MLVERRKINLVPLNKVNDSNLLEVAESAMAYQIRDEPMFKWWVGHRVQTEYKKEGNTIRIARAWAKTLTDAEGNSLQCNVEIGGDNQQAQLLVPADNLNMARQFLQEYKESMSPFSMRENNFLKRVTQAHPTEI